MTLSRRSAVRGAVWTLPAVTVATTAPAFANTSGGMALSGFTAAYVAPDRLVISGTVVAGAVAQAGTLTFTTEPNLFGSVAVVAGATGAVVPSTGGGFSITYPVTPGPFTTTLDLGDDDLDGLFRGYRGEQTFLMADIEPSVSDPESVPVAAKPMSAMPPVTASASWLSWKDLRVSADNVRLRSSVPQPAVGRLRVAALVPTDRPGDPTIPGVSNIATGWELDPLFPLATNPAPYSDGWLVRFVTTQAAHTSMTGVDSDRGPAAFSFDLDVTGSGDYSAGTIQLTVTSDETAFGWPNGDSKAVVQTPQAAMSDPPPAPPA